MAEVVLDVQGLTVVRRGRAESSALLQDVSLDAYRGEVVGLVGESGAGKSVLLASVLRLLRPPSRVVSGTINYIGESVSEMTEERLSIYRGTQAGYIGANAHSLLNPMMTVGQQVVRYVTAHQDVNRKTAKGSAIEMFRAVGIPDPVRRFDAYPHELSGGMAQRVAVAIGLINSPQLVVADEPTFGLDVTIQIQVLDLVMSLVRDLNAAATVMIATRDLGIIANFADRVVALESGRVVSSESVDVFLSNL